MINDFETILGLSLSEALQILEKNGIVPQIIYTQAPPRRVNIENDNELNNRENNTETRVIAVRDLGKTLIVSRFFTEIPQRSPVNEY